MKTKYRKTECRMLLVLFAALAMGSLAATAQEPELIATYDAGKHMPVLAAWAPDGRRLAYGTERELAPRGAKKDDDDVKRAYPAEVWLADLEKPDKKPKRLLDYREVRALNYRIDRLSWSPDGKTLAAEMTDRRGETATFFFTAKGRLAPLGGRSRFNFVSGYGGGWMGDSLSYGLLEEAFPPRVLHQIKVIRIEGGRMLERFPNDLFAAVSWLPSRNRVAAIRRDREFEEPPELVIGNLDNGKLESLGEIPEYQGRLQTVPGEAMVSYFVGAEELALRPLELDAVYTTVPVPMGPYKWSPTGEAIYYLKLEDFDKNTGRLMRVEREGGERKQVLTETLWDFWISPDGNYAAVLTAGRNPVLKVYKVR